MLMLITTTMNKIMTSNSCDVLVLLSSILFIFNDVVVVTGHPHFKDDLDDDDFEGPTEFISYWDEKNAEEAAALAEAEHKGGILGLAPNTIEFILIVIGAFIGGIIVVCFCRLYPVYQKKKLDAQEEIDDEEDVYNDNDHHDTTTTVSHRTRGSTNTNTNSRYTKNSKVDLFSLYEEENTIASSRRERTQVQIELASHHHHPSDGTHVINEEKEGEEEDAEKDNINIHDELVSMELNIELPTTL
mmetsp:Transcript_24207/g.25990  ORF Transcript_24207/g.25990 Transcript_24207/m.25990 type:complete len:244 (+) Transcript_24207:47-778(+)